MVMAQLYRMAVLSGVIKMNRRILAYAVIILSAAYFYGSGNLNKNVNAINVETSKAEGKTEDILLSCSLPPLDIKVMNNWSIIAKYDTDDLKDDYHQVFTNVVHNIQGTGSCRTYSWLINYMGIPYQISEIGCHPGNDYHVPKNATAKLVVGGDITDYTSTGDIVVHKDSKILDDDSITWGSPILENGSTFWCY